MSKVVQTLCVVEPIKSQYMRNFKINEKGEIILQINLGNNLESALCMHQELLKLREQYRELIPKESLTKGEDYLDVLVRKTAMEYETIQEFYILNPSDQPTPG